MNSAQYEKDHARYIASLKEVIILSPMEYRSFQGFKDPVETRKWGEGVLAEVINDKHE